MEIIKTLRAVYWRFLKTFLLSFAKRSSRAKAPKQDQGLDIGTSVWISVQAKLAQKGSVVWFLDFAITFLWKWPKMKHVMASPYLVLTIRFLYWSYSLQCCWPHNFQDILMKNILWMKQSNFLNHGMLRDILERNWVVFLFEKGQMDCKFLHFIVSFWRFLILTESRFSRHSILRIIKFFLTKKIVEFFE